MADEHKGLYKSFLENIDLKDIQLKELDLVRHRIIGKGKSPEGKLELNLEKIENEQVDNFSFKYYVKAKIVGYTGDENDCPEQKKDFEISIAYEVLYGLNEELELEEQMKQECIEKFQDSALFNVWPYLRETVNTLSDKMGITLPKLPLLKTYQKLEG